MATAAWAQEDGPPGSSTTPAALAAAAAGIEIAIVDDTLTIGGTAKDDRILIKATRHPDTVRVIINHLRLGRYGPIARIEVDAGDGDDVVRVSGAVELPAQLNGGPGADRLRGGAGPDLLFGEEGDDRLVATFGRDGLDGGAGNNRLVVRGSMGEIRVGASAASDALRVLAKAYDLPPLENALPPSATAPGPIIVGPDELHDDATVDLLRTSYQAGHTVALAGAEASHAELLQDLLGHDGGASWNPEIPRVELIAYRTAIRPDGGTNNSTSILPPPQGTETRQGRRETDMAALEWLSQVFSGRAVLTDAGNPCANVSPDQCLQTLANSHQFTIKGRNAFSGLSVEIIDFVWAARSFLNRFDLYYVFQEVTYDGTVPIRCFEGGEGNCLPWEASPTNFFNDPDVNATLIMPSPTTTQVVTTVTTGMSQSYSGNIGYDETQGLNATAGIGVTVSSSTSTPEPPTEVVLQADDGTAAWLKAMHQIPPEVSTSLIFYNQWIWEVPFTAYSPAPPGCAGSMGQPCIQFTSNTTLQPNDGSRRPVFAAMGPFVPIPFGDTFALQSPVVTSVNPDDVCAGDEFTITGTGLYPTLVQAVLIDGEALDPSQFSTVSDTEITVVAPDIGGFELPVEVQTAVALSNADVTIEIDDIICAPAERTAAGVTPTASEAAVPAPEG